MLGVQAHMNEFANVGAGLGGRSENKTISGPDAEAWKKEFNK
jgi:hypothetical protein